MEIALRKTATTSETIIQLSLLGKWHIRTNCWTSQKRVRTQWFREPWGTNNTHNDSRTHKWQPKKNTEQTKIVCHYCKNQATLLEIVEKGWRTNRSKELILRPKAQNLRHLNQLHHVLNANGWIIPQKKVGAVIDAANRPERFKQDHPTDNGTDGQEQWNLTHPGPLSILRNSSK